MNSLTKYRIKQLLTFFFTCFFRLFSVRKKNFWLVFERGVDARDNGYYLYKYLKKNCPEIKVYFLISRDSPDRYKIEKEDIVDYFSIKACWFIANAKKIVSSHYWSVMSQKMSKIYNRLFKDTEYCFLQHGVIYNNLVSIHKKNASIDLFFCGAKPEYDYVIDNFGFSSDVVKYTGLARYDGLHDFKVKRQILVMPTWRSNIRTEKAFLNSEYFYRWQEFLNSDYLKNIIQLTNTKLIFYVHYEMQRFIKHFNSSIENIVIASFAEYDVQELLKESAVLITDYSSVFFDFAYMRKCLIYYQFDDENFFNNHYKKGYFSKDMAFGDVCFTLTDLTNSLSDVFKNELRISEKYLKRAVDFFPLHDTNNCKRIYDCIMERENG